MTEEQESQEQEEFVLELEKNDRVRRKGAQGCLGTVRDIRAEVTNTSNTIDEKGLLVSVLWDNGTFSYFTPAALEKV